MLIYSRCPFKSIICSARHIENVWVRRETTNSFNINTGSKINGGENREETIRLFRLFVSSHKQMKGLQVK